MKKPAPAPAPDHFMGPTFLFTGIGLSLIMVSRLLGAGTTTHHLVLLLVLLPFTGIPHGALDYALARGMLRHRFGRFWGVGFVTLYLLAMALVVLLWHYQATFSLAAFLVLTYYHFSSGDALASPQTPWTLRITEWVSRGGIVLCFPAWFDRSQVQRLLTYLAPAPGVERLLDVMAAMAPLCALAAAIGTAGSLGIGVRQRSSIDLARGLELGVLAAIFALLPALLAFTIYFSFLHALRHMLNLDPARGRPAFGVWLCLLRLSLPVTLATLLVGAGAYALLGGPAFEASHLMRVIFIGIASMTYPHAVVVAWADRARHRPQPFADAATSRFRGLGRPLQETR